MKGGKRKGYVIIVIIQKLVLLSEVIKILNTFIKNYPKF